MCGIIYCRSNGAKTNKIVEKMYHKQSLRGKSGYGFIAPVNGKIVDVKRAEEEKEILGFLRGEVSDEILFHHRTPTSTPNFIEATHPIRIDHASLKNRYYVVHNGIISNDFELRKKHHELGFKYSTDIEKKTKYETKDTVYSVSETTIFNDSECFGFELALFLEGREEKIGARGSIAFIAFETDKEDNILKLHYGRNSGNPLILENSKEFFVLKSEGIGAPIAVDTLYTMDYPTGIITSRAVPIGVSWKSEIVGGAWKGLGYKTTFDDEYDEEIGKWKDKNIFNDVPRKLVDDFDAPSFSDELNNIYSEIDAAISELDFVEEELCGVGNSKDVIEYLMEEKGRLEARIADLEAQADILEYSASYPAIK